MDAGAALQQQDVAVRLGYRLSRIVRGAINRSWQRCIGSKETTVSAFKQSLLLVGFHKLSCHCDQQRSSTVMYCTYSTHVSNKCIPYSTL